jgi:pimeloyl-ACP methyl ester carboxylesterase
MAPVAQFDVVVNGVRSPVRSCGPQQAREAVVFVHGNPGSSEDWAQLLPQVGEFARAIAPDMPGFGKADRPENFDYTIAGYVRHLDGLLRQLGIDRVHLVLHDFGGAWGLAWAGEHVEAVASLTLINIGALPGYRWHKYARIWRLPLLGELYMAAATRGAFRLQLNADNPRKFPRAFTDRMYDDLDRGMKRAILKLYRATSDLDAITQSVAAQLSTAEFPVLVLWGTGDSYVPVRFAQEQPKFFRKVEAVHLLEGCGHWPFIDEPEKVAALVLPYLRRQCPQAG